jgi:hypothetical protein
LHLCFAGGYLGGVHSRGFGRISRTPGRHHGARYRHAPRSDRSALRLIVQSVKKYPDGTPTVLDAAAHLIFRFETGESAGAQPGCWPRPLPDLVAFRAIVGEIADLRTKLSLGQLGANRVTTSGVPFGVHPGQADSTAATREKTGNTGRRPNNDPGPEGTGMRGMSRVASLVIPAATRSKGE